MSTATDENDSLSQAERALSTAFSPHSPISRIRLLRGRTEQVREVADAVSQAGLHVVIFGERGVGKTSLANILSDFFGFAVPVSKAICSQGDTFSVLIRRLLGSISLTMEQPALGLVPKTEQVDFSLALQLPPEGSLAPDTVAALVSSLPGTAVFVVDEFDRLPRHETVAFADLIKALSDRGAEATVVLVGVAEDVDQLVANHASIVRCLRQIKLQRMSDAELREIVLEGYKQAGMRLQKDAPLRRILSVSQGFPHYTHLLAQYAGRAAVDGDRLRVTDDDVVHGMKKAVERADQTNRDLYHRATTGTKKGNIWNEVAAACALAETDDRGYFSSRAVQEKLSEILAREIRQETFSYHLGKLTEEDRGPS